MSNRTKNVDTPVVSPIEGLTPVLQRIFTVLADGLPHHKEELADEQAGEYSTTASVRMHLLRLRAHLRLRGEDILVQYMNGRPYYRVVRLLSEGLPVPNTK